MMGETFVDAETGETRHKALGRLPAKTTRKALFMSEFVKSTAPDPPKRTNFWKRRTPFPTRSFGNLDWGNCTRAKQAIASMRMERLEVRRTPQIEDEEVIRVYREMVRRLYDTDEDMGAYEDDALNEWRNPEHTFRDAQGRPLTIDAYVKLNAADHYELKQAIAASGAHGIAVCFNLPLGLSTVDPPRPWDVPDGQPLVGRWKPGTWGGHSMWCRDYDEDGIWVAHTWELVDQLVTWDAVAAYMDEAHLVIDSMNYWRKNKPEASKFLKLADVRDAVNAVSSIRIAA